jgi:hypothetical protein
MRVAIAGAGIVGRSIAAELLENGHEVLLVDKAPSAIKVDSVPTAEWLLADACEMSSLDEAGVARCQVVVAATGDDKGNLVVSLLAKTEYGVPRTVARVNNPKNEWMFNEAWGVDVAGVDAPAHDGPGRGSRERRRPGPDLHLPAVEDRHVRADAARRLADDRTPGRATSGGRGTPCWSRSFAEGGRSHRPTTIRWSPGTSCCSSPGTTSPTSSRAARPASLTAGAGRPQRRRTLTARAEARPRLAAAYAPWPAPTP